MTAVEKEVRFLSVTSRVHWVFARRLRVTLLQIVGRVDLLPHVDGHYRDWLKAVQRRERVFVNRRMRAWKPPVVEPIGNLNELLARTRN